MDEITAFTEYLTRSVNRRLLRLLSWVLEMPDEYLWDNIESHSGPVNEGYLRHALFHPFKHQEKGMGEGLKMFGHTDFGTTTLLFSVPVTCLQIWGRDDIWRYVEYSPGALVVNIGDTLEREWTVISDEVRHANGLSRFRGSFPSYTTPSRPTSRLAIYFREAIARLLQWLQGRSSNATMLG
jgi:isopenicillin N synthase-like dioxygenase